MTEGEMKQCEHTGSHFASWKNFRFSILDFRFRRKCDPHERGGNEAANAAVRTWRS